MSICGDLNCSQCCHDREVILTHEDIDRLLTMGHYEQTFARISKWGYNLKELIFVDGKCVFLENGQCSVYQNRPTACKVFPLTSNGNSGVIDPSCPHASGFKTDKVFLSEANTGLKRIIKDIESTIKRATTKDMVSNQ